MLRTTDCCNSVITRQLVLAQTNRPTFCRTDRVAFTRVCAYVNTIKQIRTVFTRLCVGTHKTPALDGHFVSRPCPNLLRHCPRPLLVALILFYTLCSRRGFFAVTRKLTPFLTQSNNTIRYTHTHTHVNL